MPPATAETARLTRLYGLLQKLAHLNCGPAILAAAGADLADLDGLAVIASLIAEHRDHGN